MRLKQLPKTTKAVDTRYLSNLGIQAYGDYNLYPQMIRNIVNASKTAGGCMERYIDFMEGQGIINPELSEFVLNRAGQTLADIHALTAEDFAYHEGFALHVNYNVKGEIVEIQPIPFENVRLAEPDEEGFVKRVAVHPDWTGKSSRNGRAYPVNAETVDFIDIFNPDPSIVALQMMEAGGPEFYKGQVLYFSSEGHMLYPHARYHSVLTDMSTDEGLSNLSHRNVRNNFLPAGAWVHMKDQTLQTYDDDGNPKEEESLYSEDLAAVQGDMNALAIMDFTVNTKEEMPTFVPIQGQNIDKSFTATADEVKDCIYSAFGQEAFLSLRNGKVGFSGNLITEAEMEYSKHFVKRYQKMTRAYLALLSHWTMENPLPAEATMDNLAIVPLFTTNTTSL